MNVHYIQLDMIMKAGGKKLLLVNIAAILAYEPLPHGGTLLYLPGPFKFEVSQSIQEIMEGLSKTMMQQQLLAGVSQGPPNLRPVK